MTLITAPTRGDATDLFLGLTPDAVLAALQAEGIRCTPLCWPLNSYENRVVEVERADEARTHLVAKFYRPLRWSAAQIREEHALLQTLEAEEVPVVAPIAFPGGGTLRTLAVADGADEIHFALFPRFGGRAPEEVSDAMAERLGALCARIHVVGRRAPFEARLQLGGTSMGSPAIARLRAAQVVPAPLARRFFEAADAVVARCDADLAGVALQRIHGDFHLGNLIERDETLFALDFDDALMGPAVQDLWMLLPGRDLDTRRRRALFLRGYDRFAAFDSTTLRLIEPLRALRQLHFCGWLSARWHDPIFPQTWPQFAEMSFWQGAVDGLQEALELADAPLETLVADVDGDAVAGAAEGPTNADFFWDWEG
jgi:Ser/Thr protein kinase RdoA (MazF antagonist)